jgi:hypothetical protein
VRASLSLERILLLGLPPLVVISCCDGSGLADTIAYAVASVAMMT